MSVKNTENAKQEEAHNFQKDNQSPSICLDFGCFVKILKNLSFFNLVFQSHFWHLLLLLILFLLPLSFHYLDYLSFLKDSQNFFENTLILTSYDSYFYAKGAREFLESLNFNLPYLSLVGGVLAKVFGLSNVLVWGSVILSASFGLVLYFLIFVVLEFLAILTLRANQLFAFLGAFLGALAPHFYQRSGVGYFDTDMLILSLPLLAILCFWQYLIKQRFCFLALFGITAFLAVGWHSGIQNLLLVGFLLYGVYEIFNFVVFRHFKSPILEISSVFLILLTFSSYTFFALLLVLVGLFFKKSKISLVVFFIACGYACFLGLFNPIIAQLKAYLFGEIQYSKTFIYASVVDSILETSKANFLTLAQRSGGVGLLFFGLVGFVGFGAYFAFLKKNFVYLYIFLLPFLFLGFASLKLGVRFSLFLSPILALGSVLLVVGILKVIPKFLKSAILIFAGLVALWVANLEYAIPKPILKAKEIEGFRALPFASSDIVFSWWDYGYALEYFTNATILLHGGRHSGSVNYTIAEILLNSSSVLGKNFSLILAQKMEEIPKQEWNLIFEEILSQNGESPKEFLKQLASDSFKVSHYPKGEVYWVLPSQMLYLAANINGFRNVDLESGERLGKGVFWYGGSDLETKEEYTIFRDFYLKKIGNGDLLAKLNFYGTQVVLDLDYLKSNLIQWLVFKNNPAMDLVFENDFVVIYQIPKE